MKGEDTSCARRLAISVLPQPVGPIIRMFLGVICAGHQVVALHVTVRVHNTTHSLLLLLLLFWAASLTPAAEQSWHADVHDAEGSPPEIRPQAVSPRQTCSHLCCQDVRELVAAPAVPQRDCDGTLCILRSRHTPHRQFSVGSPTVVLLACTSCPIPCQG